MQHGIRAMDEKRKQKQFGPTKRETEQKYRSLFAKEKPSTSLEIFSHLLNIPVNWIAMHSFETKCNYEMWMLWNVQFVFFAPVRCNANGIWRNRIKIRTTIYISHCMEMMSQVTHNLQNSCMHLLWWNFTLLFFWLWAMFKFSNVAPSTNLLSQIVCFFNHCERCYHELMTKFNFPSDNDVCKHILKLHLPLFCTSETFAHCSLFTHLSNILSEKWAA